MRIVDVNPEILRWARETAGLGLAEAVGKLQLRSARGVERLEAERPGAERGSRPNERRPLGEGVPGLDSDSSGPRPS